VIIHPGKTVLVAYRKGLPGVLLAAKSGLQRTVRCQIEARESGPNLS